MGAPLPYVDQKIQSLSEILGKDLVGYQLAWGYYLELGDGLMGFFPAVVRNDEIEQEPMVICLNKASLRKVWDRLEARPARIGRTLFLITPDQDTGFSVTAFANYFGGSNKPGSTPVLTDEAMDKLCKIEKPFAWACGLLQLKDMEVKVPDFDS